MGCSTKHRVDKMRILFINALYHPYLVGGTEIVLKGLVEELHNKGNEVKVLTLWDKDDEEELVDGIPVFRAKVPNVYLIYTPKRPDILKRRLWHLIELYNPIAKKIVSDQLKTFKPDIVQIHNMYGWSCSIWDAVSEFKIPTIQVLHDLYLLCPRNMFKNNSACRKQCLICKIMRLPYKLKSNNLKAVIGVSNFILDRYLRYGYFKDVPIKKVIYNNKKVKIDTSIVKESVDIRYINFGFIGTLKQLKGIEVLLKAYLKVKKTNYRLFVAGTGKQGYERYLKSKYKDDSIIFLGKVEPEKFFERVDATIVPSIWYENLPTVVIESLSFGVPIIASKIGGIPEMIVEGVNGMFFDPYKEGDLEQKILKFEKEIHIWRSKTEEIKKSSRKFTNYEKWIDEWEKLMQEIIY